MHPTPPVSHPCRTVIIAKAPRAGYAKTRLIPALGADGAADLARRLLHHAVAEALAAGTGPVELCAAPSAADALWATQALPDALNWSDQGDGDLGARMARAARRTLDGGECILLIGTDCPALDAATLRRAAASLRDHDATLVPTADGGYALLGLRRLHPGVFTDMPWSTDAVARITLQRFAADGWSVDIHPTLHDIDEPADLRWLPDGWLAHPARTFHAA